MNNRAIDTGYGWTKYTTGHMTRQDDKLNINVGAFQSLPFVTRASLDAPSMGKKVTTITVKVNGVTYQVSDNPGPIAPKSSTRVRGESYTQSDAYGICMCAAVKAMNVDSINHLVVGTPVSNFESAKRVLLERFGSGIKFDDKDVAIGTLHVMAQPVGGLVWHFLSSQRQSELNKRRRLLVDIGYGTLDWVVATGLTTNSERSDSAEFGVSKFIDFVAEEIKGGRSGIGEDIELYEEIDALLTRDVSFTYRGKKWSREFFSDAIERIAGEGVQRILASTGDIGLFDSVVLMGGGSRLYQSALHKIFHPIPVELVAESRFANVRGFQLIAEHQAHAPARRQP